MSIEILAFSDWVVSKIQSGLAINYPSASVTREYDIEYDLGTIEGMWVNVFPASYTEEDENRREDRFDAEVAVILMERWTQPGKPNKQWMDERVGLVQSCVFDPLRVVEEPVTGYWSHKVEVMSVFDIKMLRHNKTFWSECKVSFRKLRH